MKKNTLMIVLFILFALPIPIAVVGFKLCFVWFLAALINGASFVEGITALLGVIIGSTYLVTYIFALMKTKEEKKFFQ